MYISPKAWVAEQWAAWFGSRSNWLQFVSRCGDVCVAKSPRPMSTSTGVCLTAVVEVDVCVAFEPHGLDERGSNESATVMVLRRVVRGPVGSLLGKGPGVRRPRKTPTVSLSKRARTGGKAYAPTYTSLGPRTVTLYCATSRTLPTKERGSDISATRGQLRVTRCHTAHIRRLQHQTDMSYGAAITRHVRLAAALVLI